MTEIKKRKRVTVNINRFFKWCKSIFKPVCTAPTPDEPSQTVIYDKVLANDVIVIIDDYREPCRCKKCRKKVIDYYKTIEHNFK